MQIAGTAYLSAKEYFGMQDYTWISGLAEADGGYDLNQLDAMLASLAACIVADAAGAFEEDLEGWGEAVYQNSDDPDLARLVRLGLEYGVACGDGACANYLGALYYGGQMVDQDYGKAKELYELAESKGVVRATVNLGYIYEYGRCGEADHMKAFVQYARAAALCDDSEALYKLGDMYSRGKAVPKDLLCAYRLYERSLDASEGSVIAAAQPAIRIAGLVGNDGNELLGIPYDPMRALALYQLAEQGLRLDIAAGQTYYRKRLRQAIEGQERMRLILDGRTLDF